MLRPYCSFAIRCFEAASALHCHIVMDPRVVPIAERWQRVTDYLVQAAYAVDPEKWCVVLR